MVYKLSFEKLFLESRGLPASLKLTLTSAPCLLLGMVSLVVLSQFPQEVSSCCGSTALRGNSSYNAWDLHFNCLFLCLSPPAGLGVLGDSQLLSRLCLYSWIATATPHHLVTESELGRQVAQVQ